MARRIAGIGCGGVPTMQKRKSALRLDLQAAADSDEKKPHILCGCFE
jgi:hypothetical protein